MACKTCNTCSDIPTFQQVEQDDGEYYIEDQGGAWSIITPTSTNIGNLFQRPSFENTTDGVLWIGGSVTQNESYSGASSYRFASSARYNSPLNTIGINLYTPGNYYCFSAMVKSCCGAKIRMRIGNFTGEWVDATGCWQSVTVCTFPAAPPLIPDLLEIEAEGCTENYVDLITAVRGQSIILPFDGDSPGASWSGTPHASSSVLAAGDLYGGSLVRLTDLGFRTIAYSGHGMPPVNLPTVAYARRSGARQQRALAQSRIITITGELCGCSWKELSQKRLALIEALNLNLDGTCTGNRTLTLQYDCTDDCGETTGEPVRIEASYTGGLEGQVTRPFCERISLTLAANNDPFFYSPRQHCKIIPPGVATTVTNTGNASAQVTLFARNRGTLTVRGITNSTNNTKVGFGNPGVGVAVPVNEDLIFNNRPGSTTLKDSNGTNLNSELNVSANSQPSRFTLAKGDNVITIDATMTGANSEIVLCWRNKFLSVDSACSSC